LVDEKAGLWAVSKVVKKAYQRAVTLVAWEESLAGQLVELVST